MTWTRERALDELGGLLMDAGDVEFCPQSAVPVSQCVGCRLDTCHNEAMSDTARSRGRPFRRVDDPKLAQQMRRVTAKLEQLDQRREPLEQHRLDLIRRALKDGWSHSQIADETGLTRGRIGQIALKLKER